MKKILWRLLVIVGAAIFMAVGIFLLVQADNNTKNNTAATVATVKSYRVETTTETGADGFDGETTYYYPVFSYSVNGQEYVKEYSVGSGDRKYAVGSTVDILYNPNAPEQFHIKGDNTYAILGWIFIGAGVVILFLFGSIKLFRRR